MSKRWHSWLIEHVRSIETFATVVFDGGFLFILIYLFFEFVFYSWINSGVILVGNDETNSIISYIVLSRNLKTLLKNHIRYFIIIFLILLLHHNRQIPLMLRVMLQNWN